MANKCPKNFNKIFHQKTLAETWFSTKNCNTKQSESDKNDQSGSNDSIDSDFVASSQDTTESELRKKVKQNLPRRSTRLSSSSPEKVKRSANQKPKSNAIPLRKLQTPPRKSKTPNSSPKKKNVNISPNVSDQKLSISDVCEVNSTIIKEEIDEMLENVNDFDSIEMMHDLSGLIVGEDMSPNRLECLSSIITCKEQEEQDPLYIDEKEKKRALIEQENKKRNKSFKIKEKGKNRHSIYNESEEFSDDIIKTLGELHIKLQHTVPPQHKIENCAGSRPLNETQVALFETYGPLKRGPFTKIEDETIQKNWKEFCAIHDWDEECVEPFLNMRHEGKYYIPNLEERKNFVRFLSNGLPWRSLYSVYFRFKNLYNFADNGHYTAKEDKIIIKHISKTTPSGINKKCAELAKTLNRKRHSIWQRYQKLKVMYNIKSMQSDDSCESDVEIEGEKKRKNKRKSSSYKRKTTLIDETFKKVYKQVNWSHPLVSRFIEKLLETMTYENIDELKNETITDEIWKKMERKISIDHLVLNNFWNLQLYMQLFCPKPLYLNDLKVDLIEYLYENKIDVDSIEWDAVKKDFTGITSAFLSNVFDHLVKHVKNKTHTTCTKEIMEYLYSTHVPELKAKTANAVLPKLNYSNGRIVSVHKASFKRPSKGMTTNPFSEEECEN